MFVTLSTLTFDLDGFVQLETVPANDTGIKRRRANKVKTLDGGVVVNDRGYTDGDREIPFTFSTVSKAHSALCDRMVANYSKVEVSFYEGVFLAIPLEFTSGVKESVFTVSLIAKLT